MKPNVTIDRLRGFCVLPVILMHYSAFFPNVLKLPDVALANGYYGVTAFFCTSGFLITANMLRRYGQVAKVDMYAFYVMRIGRIGPPLALLCLVLSLLSMTTIKPFNFTVPLTLKDTLLNVITLRYNVYFKYGGSSMVVWAILWSLSIEEMFYLGYPLVAKVARNTLGLIAVLVVVIVYAPLHRQGPIFTIYEYFGCFDGIAVGALAALAAKRFKGDIPKSASCFLMAMGTGILVCTYLKLSVQTHYGVGLTLIALGAALILFASQCAPFASTQPWFYDPLAYLGRLSYEIYLFHMTIYALLSGVLMPRFVSHSYLLFIGVAFCIVASSDAIARFYAEPLNRWLRAKLLTVHRSSAAETVPI